MLLAGQGEVTLTEWDRVNSQILEFVNYARDAIRWRGSEAALQSQDPGTNMLASALRIEAHLKATLRTMSPEASDAYLLALRGKVNATWSSTDLRGMLEQLLPPNQSGKLLESVPRLVHFQVLMADQLPDPFKTGLASDLF